LISGIYQRRFVEEARDADLVVLEGMGRGIETNLYARFSIDSVKLAMVKHKEVATLLGGELYDCVCKFDEGDC
jgi:cobyric acid synthase